MSAASQPSAEKARTLIMAGSVYVNNQKFDKPGDTVSDDAEIEVRGSTLKYVSRGGLKLEKAMQLFPIDLNGKICMDIGASTGGFTDCMLQNGAQKVYSVDVGYGQLAWQLRQDPRVVNLERTNARYLTRDQGAGRNRFLFGRRVVYFPADHPAGRPPASPGRPGRRSA